MSHIKTSNILGQNVPYNSFPPDPLGKPTAQATVGEASSRASISGSEKVTVESNFEAKRLGEALSRLSRCAIDFIMILISLAILVLVFLFKKADGNTIGSYEQTLMNIARVGTTAFPFVFAFIIGRSTRNLLQWKLEQGIDVTSVAYLQRSITLFSAYTTPLQIRIFHWIPVVAVMVWAMSPLGSQATLRSISAREAMINSSTAVTYLDTHTRTREAMMGSSNSTSSDHNLATWFLMSLLAVPSNGFGPRDSWGNAKIPFIDTITDKPDGEGWVHPSGQSNYSSLLGVPFRFSKADEGSNSTFKYRTMYHSFTDVNVTQIAYTNDEWFLCRNSTAPGCQSAASVYFTKSPPGYQAIDSSNGLFRFLYPISDINIAGPRRIVLEWAPIGYSDEDGNLKGINRTLHLETIVKHVWVEAEIFCIKTECSTISLRNTTAPADDYNTTTLFGTRFLSAFGQAFPVPHPGSPLPNSFELYLTDPSQSPFNMTRGLPIRLPNGHDDTRAADISLLPPSVLARRLSQLINTYWMAAIGIAAYTEPLDAQLVDVLYFSSAATQLDLGTATGTHLRTRAYLHCDRAWLTVLLLAGLVVLAGSVASAVLAWLAIGPECTDYVSAFTRAYNAPRWANGSGLDPDRRVRAVKDLVIRIGDAAPHEETGNIVIGPSSDVAPLRQGRVYR